MTICMIWSLLLCVIAILFSLVGDLIVVKTKLKYSPHFMAEIICFDEIHYFRGVSKVSIVKYKTGDKEKVTLVDKSKKDKIGDQVHIVTDGNLTARNELVNKNDSYGYIVLIVLGLFFFGRSGMDVEVIGGFIALGFMSLVMLIFIVAYPLFYEMHYQELKEKLQKHTK